MSSMQGVFSCAGSDSAVFVCTKRPIKNYLLNCIAARNFVFEIFPQICKNLLVVNDMLIGSL